MLSNHRLQLSLNAKGLKNLAGVFNTSDPFAVVTVRGDAADNPPVIVGQTEVVYNSLNPQWTTVIFIDGYKFGVPFYIEVGVFDFDAKSVGKSEKGLAMQSSETGRLITTANIQGARDLLRAGTLVHKIMGTALFDVGQILGSKGNVASKSLQTGGALYAFVERSRSDAGAFGVMNFQLQGLGFTNLRTMGLRSSPFFELHRIVDSPNGVIWRSVYRSNVVKGHLNPKWEATTLQLEAVCNGDLNRPVKIVVKDYRSRFGKHVIMGEVETTMQRFIDCKNEGGDFDMDLAFTLRRDNEDVGKILVLQASLEGGKAQASGPAKMMRGRAAQPEFLDYLAGGCQINLAVAIDFTASNGNPRQKGTLHYVCPPSANNLNDYEVAIKAVGSILAKYDSDGMVPTWGFGARTGSASKVQHCFQCGDKEEVEGVQGILDAYRGVFKHPLQMSFPTDFTEVIRTAAHSAQVNLKRAQVVRELSYTILLILTAGSIENVKETQRALAMASDYPISVVIVGIGNSEFGSMEFLDEHDPDVGGRDITKFVLFNDYHRSPNLLTEAVLDEIPHQLVDYFFKRGIMPGQVVAVDRDAVLVKPADDDERTVCFLG